MGENWTSILNIFDTYSNIVLVILVIIFFGFIFWFYKVKDKKKNGKKA